MAENETRLTFPALFMNTMERHGNSNFLSFVDETPVTYREAHVWIRSVMAFLEANDVVKGDRVAILSTNMPNWGLTYFGITFLGAVAVPVLPDFSSGEIENVISHSGAKVLFVSSNLIHKTADINTPELCMKVLIDDFSIITSSDPAKEFLFGSEPKVTPEISENDLASIIYTSGTTGKSKGVMLTHRNISFTGIKGRVIQYLDETDRFLSVLPLSHTYENTLGLILPMLSGSCVYYLRKPPTPPVLLPALQTVKPTTMLTVPLIIEKIYFNKILPAFREKFILRMLHGIPPFRKVLHKAAGKKLMDTFGGHIKFFGVGGAKLNPVVEKFLVEAGFPYAIGYGLTETSPLLAGANPSKSVYESTGPAMEGVELKINNPDPKTGEGEIWAKGPNVMTGYYKEPEMTREVITPDGWFRTGDLGVFDRKNNLFIRGRLKNMIVGSSGENIYPEEIESVINNFRFVVESLVVEQKGKLVALVHINMEELEKKYNNLRNEMSQYEERIEEMLEEIREYVNARVNKYHRINKVILQPVPFQKTATMKIKRFLYT
ncbi:MAG: AMP-binding protein [Bacteroidales bacterium]